MPEITKTLSYALYSEFTLGGIAKVLKAHGFDVTYTSNDHGEAIAVLANDELLFRAVQHKGAMPGIGAVLIKKRRINKKIKKGDKNDKRKKRSKRR